MSIALAASTLIPVSRRAVSHLSISKVIADVHQSSGVQMAMRKVRGHCVCQSVLIPWQCMPTFPATPVSIRQATSLQARQGTDTPSTVAVGDSVSASKHLSCISGCVMLTALFTSWQKVSIVVVLNSDPSSSSTEANGVLSIYFNDKHVFTHNYFIFTTKPSVDISSIFFSTFFGGSSEKYASKGGYAYFRNMKVCTMSHNLVFA